MNGRYGNEEQRDFGFDYLYDYDGGPRGKDGFTGKGKRGFEAALLAELVRIRDSGEANTPKAGVYIHGYNNDWQESIDEVYDVHGALAKAVGYAPVLVGFSWPASSSVLKYLSDREEVRDSVPAFTRFLVELNDFLTRHERDCFSTSFCIAHSMGNYLLRKGMEYLSDALGTPVGRMMFSETVLLAPDLASTDLEVDGKGQYIADFSRRVHVYYSRFDRALKASSVKRFGGRRLGRSGPERYARLAENVIAVNCERYANSEALEGIRDRAGKPVSVHSGPRYHPEIVADIVHAISSVDREKIPTRRPADPPTGEPNVPPRHYELVERPKGRAGRGRG
jgi:hypothetical protein